ncbi:MAG: hypothetical protein LBU65_12135 [Planctomycetaceae bacterium]|nr:hypothetical protein [Planctomycetaceae bacterium]
MDSAVKRLSNQKSIGWEELMANSNKYAEFWKWFENNSEMVFNFENDMEKTFDLLGNELKKIDENLTFEFGPIENNKREFIVSADGIKDSFGEVEKLYNQKPELEKWTIIKFRPRRNGSYSIKIDNISLSPDDVYFKLFQDDSKVGILAFIKNYNENTKVYNKMVFLLLDQLLGEYDVETKVGAIEISDFDSNYFPNSSPFNMLPKNFDYVYEKINNEK